MIRYTALFSAVLGNQAPRGLLFLRLLPRRAIWGAILSYSFLSFFRLVFTLCRLGQALPTTSILPCAAATLFRYCLVLAYFGARPFKPLPFGLAACGVADGAAAFSRCLVVPTQAFFGLLQSFIFFPTSVAWSRQRLVLTALGHGSSSLPFFDSTSVGSRTVQHTFRAMVVPTRATPLFWTFQSFKFSLFMRRCGRLASATPALGCSPPWGTALQALPFGGSLFCFLNDDAAFVLLSRPCTVIIF